MCVSYRIREWHRSSVIVQIHSHTIKLPFHTKARTYIPSWQMILHTPDISVEEITSFSRVWCCSQSKTPALTLFNLHNPAVCSWIKTLWSQNTGIEVKSLWIIRKRLFVPAVCHTGQIIRQNKPWICSVWIQNHGNWWDTFNRCCYSDAHIMIKNEQNTDYYELWHPSCWSNTDIFLRSSVISLIFIISV